MHCAGTLLNTSIKSYPMNTLEQREFWCIWCQVNTFCIVLKSNSFNILIKETEESQSFFKFYYILILVENRLLGVLRI